MRNNQWVRCLHSQVYPTLRDQRIDDPHHHRQHRPNERTNAMSITHTPDEDTMLPDEETLAATVAGDETHGFSVEVVHSLDAARDVVLARIPRETP
jgi:hypothetical protein